MPKFFIGLIAGLAFATFLPQAALALAIIAAIGLAVSSQEHRRRWQGESEKGKASRACNETARKGIIKVRELKQSDEQIFQRFLKHEGYDAIARDNCTTPEHIRQIVVKQQQRIAKQKSKGE